MKFRKTLAVSILCVGASCFSARLWAQPQLDRDAVRAALEARDASIQSSTLSISSAWISFGVDPLPIIEDAEAELRSQSPEDVFQHIVRRVADGQPVSWARYETVERGDAFRTITTAAGGPVMRQYGDGERNVLFSPMGDYVQIDIHPLSYNQTHRFSMDQLLFRLAGLFNSRNLVEFAAASDGYSLSFEHGGGDWSTDIKLTPDLTIAEFRSSLKRRLVERRWYLAPRPAGSYMMPRIVVSHYPDDQRPAVSVVLVEEVALNGAIPDEALRIPEMPEGAVVVDHRADPPTVQRVVSAQRLRSIGATPDLPTAESPVMPSYWQWTALVSLVVATALLAAMWTYRRKYR